MSQQLVGIPYGKNRLVFFDMMFVLLATVFGSMITHRAGYVYSAVLFFIFGFLLLISPIRMSTMFPIGLIMILDESEEKREP